MFIIIKMANDNQNWKDKLSPDQFYVTRMKGTEKVDLKIFNSFL